MGYLDIERLIRSQVNLADFLRSYLNIQQKTLLAHQKTRFIPNSSSSSESSDDHGAYAKVDPEMLER